MDSSYADFNTFKEGSKKVHENRKGKNYVKNNKESKDKKYEKGGIEMPDPTSRSIYGSDTDGNDESQSERRTKVRKRQTKQA